MSSISAADASILSQAQLAQEVSIKIASKTLDAARAQGDAAISLLQAAAATQQQALDNLEPNKGQTIDVSA
jgi:Putative motility protein